MLDRREVVRTIRFGLYNIYNDQNGGLESALRGMFQANIDLGIFQDTKVTGGIFERDTGGYRVAATKELILHCGRVSVFCHKAEHFTLEALCLHIPNIVSF